MNKLTDAGMRGGGMGVGPRVILPGARKKIEGIDCLGAQLLPVLPAVQSSLH